MAEPINPNGHLVGIDADVHRIAWAYLYCGEVRKVGEFPRANSKGRIDKAYVSSLMGLMTSAQWSGATLWLEDIFLAEKGTSTRRNVEGFKRLSWVQGEILIFSLMKAVPLEMVHPATWMSGLFGRGRGQGNTKELSMAWARSLWDCDITQHQADAICIATWAWEQVKMSEQVLFTAQE